MKNNIIKNTLYIFLFSCMIASIFIINKKINSKEVVLDDVVLKENITNKNTFAIMLEDEETGKYIESESSAFPTKGYAYNNSKSGCVDAKGNIIEDALSYNTTTNKVNIRVAKEAYCYLYFDIEELSENWVYYGWNGDTPSNTFDGARGSQLVALRSKTGVKYENVTIDDVVQACGLINGSMVCADFFNPSRGDVPVDDSINDGSVSRCVYSYGYGICDVWWGSCPGRI